MTPDFQKLYVKLKHLGLVAAGGALLLIVAAVHGTTGGIGSAALWLGVIAVLPAFLFAYCLTILHWKHRYVGQRSTLWGVLLLVETSGWFKIVYFFRHMLPDMRSIGRYRRSSEVK